MRFYDQYKPFASQPECSGSNPHSHWQDSDPRKGQDIEMWEEIITEESQRSCEGGDGKWKNGFCYRYKVVTNICFMVTEDSNNHDIDDGDKWRVT